MTQIALHSNNVAPTKDNILGRKMLVNCVCQKMYWPDGHRAIFELLKSLEILFGSETILTNLINQAQMVYFQAFPSVLLEEQGLCSSLCCFTEARKNSAWAFMFIQFEALNFKIISTQISGDPFNKGRGWGQPGFPFQLFLTLYDSPLPFSFISFIRIIYSQNHLRKIFLLCSLA